MDVADAAWTTTEEAGVAHAVDMPIMLPRTTESADIKTQFFLASACCVLPLLLIVAGVGGAWMANLRILDPYAPYLDVIVLIFLGYAHIQNYREQKAAACGSCSSGGRLGRWKTPLLWMGTVFVIVMLALPHVLPRLLM